jgi:signal transduction histidine kinase
MNLRALFTSPFFIRIILVISVFLLIFISSVSYKHTNALIESTELLGHSYKIQVKLAQLLAIVEDAETGQRGFIITNDSVFLDPYYTAKVKLDNVFRDLKSLTANNVQQYHNLDSLSHLIYLRIDLLDASLELLAKKASLKVLDANMLKGKNTMDLMRSQMNMMNDLETMYFKEHQKKYAHELYFTPVSTLFLMLFSLLVFVLAFIKINKNLIDLKKTNAALRLASESFRHAEEIGRFSSWQWYMDTNTLVFSDNQYSLLGVPAQSFEPTVENFMQFVHPDDRGIIEESVRLALEERKPSDISFRIMKRDGELRYFRSVARLTYIHNNQIFIGINSDVTDEYLNKAELEDRNRELLQSNTELASFNHIASHDLQEPLRKIQTFISRITEKDSGAISATSLEYFARIQLSVKRMRSLINDLLLFSRVTKAEKVFKKTDLNTLLENARQELISDIEEKDAVINSDTLPVLNVVPFQIQQLLLNLLGNSLKYSKKDIPPVINISCEMVDDPETPEDSGYKKFYKISVTDNGIGFEQQYAESIFILFYRLQPGLESPGTGIGLSICKKIVENHGGFITASSKPGAGATFTFFLPYNL